MFELDVSALVKCNEESAALLVEFLSLSPNETIKRLITEYKEGEKEQKIEAAKSLLRIFDKKKNLGFAIVSSIGGFLSSLVDDENDVSPTQWMQLVLISLIQAEPTGLITPTDSNFESVMEN